MYISILATLLLESTLNSKKCIRIFSLRSKILMHFFKFKLNSNNKVASIEIYTTYQIKKIIFIKISNLKKQIKINFKHKKLNYEKWVINLVALFQSYIFKN